MMQISAYGCQVDENFFINIFVAPYSICLFKSVHILELLSISYNLMIDGK